MSNSVGNQDSTACSQQDDEVVEIGEGGLARLIMHHVAPSSLDHFNFNDDRFPNDSSLHHYRHLYPDIGNNQCSDGGDENSQSSTVSDNEEVGDEEDASDEEEDEEYEEELKEDNIDLREWKIVYPSVPKKPQPIPESSTYIHGNNMDSSKIPTTSPNNVNTNAFNKEQNHDHEQPIIVHDHQPMTNEDDHHNIFIGMTKHEKLSELLDSDESPILEFTYILQTRSDDPTPYVPDHLYTSLVYQFYQSVLFHENIRKKYEKVIADVKLAFHDTGEEVVKIIPIPEVNQKPIPANLIPEKQGGSSKEVISGDTKGLELIKPISQREDTDSVMENRTKFNVDVVSFHYKHRPFCLQLRYYFPEDYPPMRNDDHSNDRPFCIIHSAPFTTSARRKNSQRMIESKKRKKLQRLIDRKREKLQTLSQQQMEMASSPQTATLDDFANKLKELVYFSAVLSNEDKRIAIQTALRSLVQNDRDI
ncbi:hypothetical protein C9374_001572 [Naegleria lovaniensis]|uniref:Uncharacterized protein n=1 Tax=Naegleria lovaniensis TaxID=51637 RepID=A0AA88GUN7_NAELO|nr:uncharacterized protein C9374_001572 [Naegleria lovaniensis]KAG2387240.1 hypothetical protein C9374_001572 [Naegleria lovaniensis]